MPERFAASPLGLDCAPDRLDAHDLLDRRGVSFAFLADHASPQLIRIPVEVLPPFRGRVRRGTREDQRTRPLRSGRREQNGCGATLADAEDRGAPEACGIHDGLDLVRPVLSCTDLW